jgi:hypothetical protein
MTFLKLTRLYLTLRGEVKESVIYVNPQHIKVFSEQDTDNFNGVVTAISWNNTSFNETYVKETPSEILEQLKL